VSFSETSKNYFADHTSEKSIQSLIIVLSTAFTTNILATQIVDLNAQINFFEGICHILSSYNKTFSKFKPAKTGKKPVQTLIHVLRYAC